MHQLNWGKICEIKYLVHMNILEEKISTVLTERKRGTSGLLLQAWMEIVLVMRFTMFACGFSFLMSKSMYSLQSEVSCELCLGILFSGYCKSGLLFFPWLCS